MFKKKRGEFSLGERKKLTFGQIFSSGYHHADDHLLQNYDIAQTKQT